MKYQITLIAALLLILGFQACKDDSDDPQPQPSEKYTVSYQLEMSGEYDSLKLSYYEPSSVEKMVNNPGASWGKNFDNFAAGDSVVLTFDFRCRPYKEVTYVYNVDISNPDYTKNQNVTQTITAADSAMPIHVEWRFKIPE